MSPEYPFPEYPASKKWTLMKKLNFNHKLIPIKTHSHIKEAFMSGFSDPISYHKKMGFLFLR
jgi:hypothetical protein